MEKCNLDNLTYGQIKELKNLIHGHTTISSDHPFEIGKKYLIRTVTFTLAGRVTEKYQNFLVINNAVWIADTGIFSKAVIDKNTWREVEDFKEEVFVNKMAIVDATKIHDF